MRQAKEDALFDTFKGLWPCPSVGCFRSSVASGDEDIHFCAVNVIWNAMLCLLWRGLARAHKTTTTTNHEDGLAARMEATGLLGSQTLWLVTPTGAALARAA